MNTINNPLILVKATLNDFDDRYLANKEKDQSGEYVDKSLADQSLEAMKYALTELSEIQQGTENSTADTIQETITRLEAAIKSLKG